MTRTYGILTVVLLAALIGCDQETVSQVDETVATDTVLVPDSEIYGATIYLYANGRMTNEIRADRIRRFETLDSTMGYELDVDFFDSLGLRSSNLISDSGVIRESDNRLEVFGHVVVITNDTTRLTTEYLKWNPTEEQIVSDAYVEFTRGVNVMTGYGMEADPDLGRLRILKDVSGHILESDMKSAGDR